MSQNDPEYPKPPKDEKELREMGIDKASMPVQTQMSSKGGRRYDERKDAFQPDWSKKTDTQQKFDRLRPPVWIFVCFKFLAKYIELFVFLITNPIFGVVKKSPL